MPLKKHETSTIILEYTQSYIDTMNAARKKNEVTRKGLYIRAFGTLLTFLSSALITYRALNNGALSFYGTALRVCAFFILGIIFCFDTRLERSERFMYAGPKFAGFVISIVQLVGIFNTRSDALSSI